MIHRHFHLGIGLFSRCFALRRLFSFPHILQHHMPKRWNESTACLRWNVAASYWQTNYVQFTSILIPLNTIYIVFLSLSICVGQFSTDIFLDNFSFFFFFFFLAQGMRLKFCALRRELCTEHRVTLRNQELHWRRQRWKLLIGGYLAEKWMLWAAVCVWDCG